MGFSNGPMEWSMKKENGLKVARQNRRKEVVGILKLKPTRVGGLNYYWNWNKEKGGRRKEARQKHSSGQPRRLNPKMSRNTIAHALLSITKFCAAYRPNLNSSTSIQNNLLLDKDKDCVKTFAKQINTWGAAETTGFSHYTPPNNPDRSHIPPQQQWFPYQTPSVHREQSNQTDLLQTHQTPKGTLEELDDFCNQGKLKEAVQVLGLLDKQGIPIDFPRYLKLIKPCGDVNFLQEAKAVHNHLIRSGGHFGAHIYNNIIEMYFKCCSVSDAYEVFEKMPGRNLTTWDTMIMGLARNGLGEEAIDIFTQFKKTGVEPNGEMFISVFFACGVLCDIEEGMLHFESMSKDYGIVPTMEHYVSVVEMLGSTGYLDEALEFIKKMPTEPNVDVWEKLMNLCRVHGHIELGDYCAEVVKHLDPTCLNVQSKAGLLPAKEASNIAREENGKKSSDLNILDMKHTTRVYKAGDRSDPQRDNIYALLRRMSAQMLEAGYVPNTRSVLHDVDEEEKREALLTHSERLALASGLISCAPRSTIRIVKNLRVCYDCHEAFNIMSKLVGREIVMRDAKRFHHFKDGECSCKGFW